MTDAELRFATRAIRRRRIFLPLAVVGVVIGLGMGAYYLWQAIAHPGYDLAVHLVVVLLILLSARQNLRQHYYAAILAKLMGKN